MRHWWAWTLYILTWGLVPSTNLSSCPATATSGMTCACVATRVTCHVTQEFDQMPPFEDMGNDGEKINELIFTPDGDTGHIRYLQTDALQTLDAKQVRVQHLGVKEVATQAFISTDHRLTRIELQDNQISDLHPGIFNGCPNVTYIDLSKNKITAIRSGVFMGLSRLEHLYLQDNLIRSISEDAFSDLTSLEILYLSSNQLTFLFNQLRPLTSIRFLYLDGNPATGDRTLQLTPQSFSSFSEMQSIDLSSCNLKSYPLAAFMGLPGEISTIRLASNYLTDLPEGAFLHLTSLRQLDISDNLLSQVPSVALSSLKKIRTLSLAENNISSIDDGAFREMRLLVTLDLSDNAITWIAPTAFEDLPFLRVLKLGNNNLPTLESGSIAFLQTLRNLELEGNNFVCDCHLEWLRNFVDKHSVEIPGDVRCGNPAHYTILDFPSGVVQCGAGTDSTALSITVSNYPTEPSEQPPSEVVTFSTISSKPKSGSLIPNFSMFLLCLPFYGSFSKLINCDVV